MTITLGKNIASLQAMRSLTKSTNSLGQIYERLASGQRIQRASDDAAGLAIADSLRSDARLYNQAARNINDGISMLSIIDGALAAQSDILQRLTELAEQSANGVFSQEQRDALSDEYRSLLEEYDRISETTEFNGQKLINGDNSSATNILAGIDSSLDSIISIGAILSGLGYGSTGNISNFEDPEIINSNDFIKFFNLISQTFSTEEFFNTFGDDVMTETVIDSNGDERTIYVFNALQAFDGDLGFGVVFYQNADGEFESIGAVDLEEAEPFETLNLTFTDNGATATYTYEYQNYEFYNSESDTFERTALEFTGIETQSRSLRALEVLENRTRDMSSIRGQVGAAQSRLQSALSTAQTQILGISEAEQRIRSADVATEVALLLRQQILQQSASAILAQANLQPSIVLALLGK